MEDVGTFLDFVTENKAFELLSEGHSKNGELAELMLFDLLKSYGKLPPNQKKPAGFSAHDLDLSFLDKKNKPHNLEVKYKLADFGQFELKWDLKTRGRGPLGGDWAFKDYEPGSEKAGIIKTLRDGGVEQLINKYWYDIPNFYTVPKDEMTLKHRYEDKKNFPDHHVLVEPELINRYYNGKGVDYIQVCSSTSPGKGSWGLYHFGKDPANTGCSPFAPQSCKMRIRIKPRDSESNRRPTGYGFLGALNIAGLSTSNVDLANPEDIVKILGGKEMVVSPQQEEA